MRTPSEARETERFYPRWRTVVDGGRRREDTRGYWWRYVPAHDAPSYDGFVREHRFAMAEHLGNGLGFSEVVHHRDRDRADNRVSNLLLIPDQELHLNLHQAMEHRLRRLVRAYERLFLGYLDVRRRGSAWPRDWSAHFKGAVDAVKRELRFCPHPDMGRTTCYSSSPPSGTTRSARRGRGLVSQKIMNSWHLKGLYYTHVQM